MTALARRRTRRALATAALVLALAWLGGGQAWLSRIDPALALPLLFPPFLLLAWWQRREGTRMRSGTMLRALFATVAVQALLALVLAGSAAWPQLAVVLAGGAVAASTADGLLRWRAGAAFLPWIAAAVVTGGWFVAGHAMLALFYRPAVASADAPPATMMTGLPLRWAGGGDIAAIIAGERADDPALVRLEAAGPVQLVDSLVESVPPSGGALLVAHPRALAPQELVAIDAFVRGGGRAVVLADALSGWPAPHAIGDPRNPPVTSLLTPLLDHWGVTLAGADPADAAIRAADVEGARLRLASAGRFTRLPRGCRAYDDAHVARCPIGAGQVWLVGDADLLFAPLWAPPAAGAEHLRPADTMAWLAARLWPRAGATWLTPVWIRRDAG